MADDLLKQIEKKLTQLENKNELKDYLLITSRNLEPEEREEVKNKLLSMDHLGKLWIDSIVKQISRAPSEYMIIEEILKKYKIMYLEGLGLYIYNGKVWKKQNDNYMMKIIGKQMGKWKIGSKTSSVLKQLKADCYEELQFNLLPVFNFQNCTLDLTTSKTHKHSADDLCSIIMEYDYAPKPEYKEWHKFVMDICIDNEPMEGFWGIMKCEMYHYGKHYNTKEELIKAIDEWIDYYMYERYQRRFGVKTPYEVRSEALTLQTPNQYPIAENKRITKYKLEHYTSSSTLTA